MTERRACFLAKGAPERRTRRIHTGLLLGLVLAAPGCFLLRASHPPVPPLGREDLSVHASPHRVAMVESGWRALALRIGLIRSAERSIELQTFIWTDDEVGKLVAHELIEAAHRGVRVRLLIDGIRTSTATQFAAFLATADPLLELRHYNPSAVRVSPAWPELLVDGLIDFGQLNQRAHDKLMVVDAERALIGGRNIENTYFDYATGMNFKDREVLVEGCVVADAVRSFERFWSYERTVPSPYLRDVALAIEAGGHRREGDLEELGIASILAEVDATLSAYDSLEDLVPGGMLEVHQVAFCSDWPGKPADLEPVNANGTPPNHVTRTLGGLVRGAERSVLVQTPYLVLSDRAIDMVEELRAEHPGISLRASTNSLAATDILAAQAATYRQKRLMLERLGIHVYEFKAQPEDPASYLEHYAALSERTGCEPTLCLHSKSIVVDDELAGVGSHNLGPRSSELNTEIMLLVWDREFAEQLARSIEKDMQPSNSWTVWKRERTPVVGEMQELLEGLSLVVSGVTTLDLWPSFYASSYELKEGADPVPPDHPEFYENYREVGLFPGVSTLDEKIWLTRLIKAFGEATTPLL